MTLIDSLDSIIMLYSYAGFPERSFAIFERRAPRRSASPPSDPATHLPQATASAAASGSAAAPVAVAMMPDADATNTNIDTVPAAEEDEPEDPKAQAQVQGKGKGKAATVVTVAKLDPDAEESELLRKRTLRVKHNAMSDLSILLTVMSILVAFSISLITTMGLIGDHCTPCQNAANAEDGGGLAGRWWRGWANVRRCRYF